MLPATVYPQVRSVPPLLLVLMLMQDGATFLKAASLYFPFSDGVVHREPNLSSKSSEVFLLDRYLAEQYEPVQTLGRYVIKRRRPD